MREKIEKDSKRLKSLERIIVTYTNPSLEPNKWTTQALGCLNKRQKLMKTSEILNCLYYNRLHELDDPIRRRNLLSPLSMALNNMCDNGILGKKRIQGEKGYFYGLAEWFEKDRQTLKEEYNEEKFRLLETR